MTDRNDKFGTEVNYTKAHKHTTIQFSKVSYICLTTIYISSKFDIAILNYLKNHDCTLLCFDFRWFQV